MTGLRSSIGLSLVALLLVVGCGAPAGSGTEEKKADTNATGAGGSAGTETQPVSAAVLCGKCGEQKGTEKCCQDAEMCACGKHKGSPLCCKKLPEEVAGKDICSGCGQVAATDHQCDANAEKCAKCGLDKGAPACCKL
jgi:hypothetical protein